MTFVAGRYVRWRRNVVLINRVTGLGYLACDLSTHLIGNRDLFFELFKACVGVMVDAALAIRR